MNTHLLKIVYVPISSLNPAPYNLRIWDEQATAHWKESIKKFGLVDPLIVNRAPKRRNVVVGGHFRLHVARELDYKEDIALARTLLHEAVKPEVIPMNWQERRRRSTGYDPLVCHRCNVPLTLVAGAYRSRDGPLKERTFDN